MDRTRVDTLTCSLSTGGSRRRALAAVFTGVITSLFARENADAHNPLKTCKKKSGKQKKACVKKAKKHNAAHATEGTDPCTGQANDTACNGDGRCLHGVCNPKPTCLPFGTACSAAGPDPSCCSGSSINAFNFLGCEQSSSGEPCHDNDLQPTPAGPHTECRSGTCVGYRCQ